MKHLFSIRAVIAFLFVLMALPGQSAELAKKKLQIFILAGQSNMVGHANPHTIATLFQSEEANDKRLLQMVFKNGNGLTQKALEEHLARAKKIDQLTGGISNEKIKAMSDGPEKKALEAEVKKLKAEYEAFKTFARSHPEKRKFNDIHRSGAARAAPRWQTPSLQRDHGRRDRAQFAQSCR